jgi:hypothetical protein
VRIRASVEGEARELGPGDAVVHGVGPVIRSRRSRTRVGLRSRPHRARPGRRSDWVHRTRALVLSTVRRQSLHGLRRRRRSREANAESHHPCRAPVSRARAKRVRKRRPTEARATGGPRHVGCARGGGERRLAGTNDARISRVRACAREKPPPQTWSSGRYDVHVRVPVEVSGWQ